MVTDVSEETAGHHGRFPLTGLQFWEEVAVMEVMQLLEIAKDDASLAPEVLGDVCSVQQGEIMGEDVAKGADVFSLCEQQLLQDTLQPPGRGAEPRSAQPKHTQYRFILILN